MPWRDVLCFVKMESALKTVLREGGPEPVDEERGKVRAFSNTSDEEHCIWYFETGVSVTAQTGAEMVCQSEFLKECGMHVSCSQ